MATGFIFDTDIDLLSNTELVSFLFHADRWFANVRFYLQDCMTVQCQHANFEVKLFATTIRMRPGFLII